MRELRAALAAVGGAAVSLLLAVLAFRVVTPAVLEAHFAGSTLVAALTALGLAGMIVVFTAWWVRRVARMLRDAAPPPRLEDRTSFDRD